MVSQGQFITVGLLNVIAVQRQGDKLVKGRQLLDLVEKQDSHEVRGLALGALSEMARYTRHIRLSILQSHSRAGK